MNILHTFKHLWIYELEQNAFDQPNIGIYNGNSVVLQFLSSKWTTKQNYWTNIFSHFSNEHLQKVSNVTWVYLFLIWSAWTNFNHLAFIAICMKLARTSSIKTIRCCAIAIGKAMKINWFCWTQASNIKSLPDCNKRNNGENECAANGSLGSFDEKWAVKLIK